MKRMPSILPWIIVAAGCSGPPVGAVRDSGPDTAAVDSGELDVVAVDTPDVVDGSALDVVAADTPDVVTVDTPDVVDASAPDVVDASIPDIVTVDAPDAGSVEPGPLTMRFEFVSSAPTGEAGGVSMRSVVVWHGSLRGSAGGLSYEGWFQ